MVNNDSQTRLIICGNDEPFISVDLNDQSMPQYIQKWASWLPPEVIQEVRRYCQLLVFK